MTRSCRSDCDGATCGLDDLLDDGETEAKTFTIDLSRALKLAKSSEQLSKVFFGDSNTCVPNFNFKNRFTQVLFILVVWSCNLDFALQCKFERVLDEIHQHLLKATFVAK